MEVSCGSLKNPIRTISRCYPFPPKKNTNYLILLNWPICSYQTTLRISCGGYHDLNISLSEWTNVIWNSIWMHSQRLTQRFAGWFKKYCCRLCEIYPKAYGWVLSSGKTQINAQFHFPFHGREFQQKVSWSLRNSSLLCRSL